LPVLPAFSVAVPGAAWTAIAGSAHVRPSTELPVRVEPRAFPSIPISAGVPWCLPVHHASSVLHNIVTKFCDRQSNRA
jgi:hypothetical protein